MNATIAGQLWVERRHHDVPATHHYGSTLVLGEYVHGCAHMRDDGRPDEDGVERMIETVHCEVGLETVHLTPVGVATDRDVDRPETALVRATVEYLSGEEDHPRARTECRKPIGETRCDGIEESGGDEQPRHGGGLAARQHQCIQSVQIGRHAYLSYVSPELAQHCGVRREGALQGKNADT